MSKEKTEFLLERHVVSVVEMDNKEPLKISERKRNSTLIWKQVIGWIGQ